MGRNHQNYISLRQRPDPTLDYEGLLYFEQPISARGVSLKLSLVDMRRIFFTFNHESIIF
jgi:hypothetical protein